MARTWLLLSLFAAHPAAAQPSNPLLELPDMTGLSPQDRASVQRFLRMPLPRVLAIGPGGAVGWQSMLDADRLEPQALANCAQRSGGRPCEVLVRDLAIVRPGADWNAPSAPPGLRIADLNHETLPDPRFFWWGPAQARGVLVFAHGKALRGGDSRGQQPQGWTRHFNNAGYDVWRFDRTPSADDTRRAAGWLRDDLAELRRRGYRHVVMAGQSRGGWNALLLMERPGLADVHIAVAPAAHGDLGSPDHLRQLDELRGIVAATPAQPEARLAIVNFRDDPFDAEPERRAALFRELGARAGAFLLIDRPEQPTGHGAGRTTAFNDRFGACLLRFATTTPPPPSC